MYKANVSTDKLAEFRINNLNDFKNMFHDDKNIELLLNELTADKQVEFMQQSVVKRYLAAGRNKKTQI
jgi:hypothetical protein